jgi:sugar phosphate isomerase/epimerase
MKISAMTNSLRLPLTTTLDKYLAMGIQGVQLVTTPEFLVMTDKRIAQIRKEVEDRNMIISAICGDIGRYRFTVTHEWQDRIAIHKRLSDIAIMLGTKIITTHIGVVADDANDPTYPVMVEALSNAAEYSKNNGTVFAIETGPECAETLVRLLDDVNSPGLGVNLDPANLRMVSCVEPDHAVEVLGKYIVHTHAKDGINTFPGLAAATYGQCNADGSRRTFTEKPATFKEVPLGQGQVNWDAYLAALKKINYDGFFAIERECGDDPEGDIRLAVDFLKSKNY